MGAALLMQVRTRFTLFGYPGLAMVLFLLAAGGGCALLFDILWNATSVGRMGRPPALRALTRTRLLM